MQDETRPSKISILPESLINKIAAGEVVERPASVVKELVENSIDAGANQILITLKNGGKDLITVLDNGYGMTETDARYAVERHATSKIADEDDLFRIQTLGFRGEALAAIASVSKFEIFTCNDEQKSATQLKLSGGVLEHQGKTGFPKGTKISVEKLFFNTPARLKFLKSTATELQHIQQHLVRLALACPKIQLRLSHNQQMLLNLSAAQDLEERIQQLFGEETMEGLLRVEYVENYLTFEGWISLPTKTRNSRRWQYLFVNDRHVKCPAVSHGIYDGYQGFLAKGRHPAFFLKVMVGPGEIDVNVHPAKTEIHFRNSQLVHTILADQLSRQIKDTTGRRFFGQDKETYSFTSPHDQSELKLPNPLPLKQTQSQPRPKSAEDVRQNELLSFSRIAKSGLNLAPAKRFVASKVRKPGNSVKLDTADTYTTNSLSGDHSALLPPGNLGLLSPLPLEPQHLRILGQLHQKHILMEHVDGLVLAKQQSVHRELIFQVVSKAVYKGTLQRQVCEVPLLVELSAKDTLIMDQHLKLLDKCGFGIDSFGGTTFSVRSLPFVLFPQKCGLVFQDFISRVSAFGKHAHHKNIQDDLLRIIAMYGAIEECTPLSLEEMKLLIAQMEQLDFPSHNSEGDRLWSLINKEELSKRLRS